MVNTKSETIDVKDRYLRGQTTNTLILSRTITQRYGLDDPSKVVIEASKQGIVIKKKPAADQAASTTEAEEL